MKLTLYAVALFFALTFSAETAVADGIFDAKDFGAKADGTSDDTRAIQSAIEAANAKGGGVVRLGSGVFLSGTIYLRDNTALEILPAATLKATTNPALYNADDFCPQNSPIKSEKASGAHLIVALEVKNVSIYGGGKIDGSGLDFWFQVPENKTLAAGKKFKYPKWRPAQMLFFCESQNVSIRDIRLFNAPFWTCFLHGCTDVFVSRVLIENDPRGHNNDGIDIDACRRATVSDCIVNSEDDSITIRSGVKRLKNKNARCEDVVITNCVLQSSANGIRIGVGDGEIRRCRINNVIIKNTLQGISLNGSYGGRGGTRMEGISISDTTVDASRPLSITTDRDFFGNPDGKSKIGSINFDNCIFSGNRTSLVAGHLNGNLSDITFGNCVFRMRSCPPKSGESQTIRNFTDWRKAGGGTANPVIVLYARNVEFDNCRFKFADNARGWKPEVKTDFSVNCTVRPNCRFDVPSK